MHVFAPTPFFSKVEVRVQVIEKIRIFKKYIRKFSTVAIMKFHFSLLERLDFHMMFMLFKVAHAFPILILTSC